MTRPSAPEIFEAETEHGALKRASVQGAALTFGSQGVRFVLQFTAQIALAHWLLPAQFGLVAMVAPVLSLVQVFNDLGLTQATIQRPAISHDELTALFWINLAVSGVLAAGLALASPGVAWFYGEPRLLPITLCFGCLLLLSGGSAQQIALLNRRMRYAALAAIDIACAAAAFAVGLGAAIAGFGTWSLVLMQAANSLTILVLAWSLSGWRPSWPRRGAGVMALLRFGGHLTAFNFLGYLETNLATILVGRFGGTAALGLYDRGYKLVIVPWWQISLPVGRVAIALLSRLLAAGGEAGSVRYARAYSQMLQGLLLVAGPGLLWSTVQAGQLVPLVLGASWREAAPIVAWLSAGTILVPFGASAYWLFVSQGRVAEQLRYGLGSGAVLIASILAGIHWGPLGVARAYAGFAPLMQGIALWGAVRSGPVRGIDIARSIYPIVLALLAALAVLSAAHVPAGLPPLQTGLLLAGCLGLSYGSCGLALLSLPAGRRILGDVWALRGVLRKAG